MKPPKSCGICNSFGICEIMRGIVKILKEHECAFDEAVLFEDVQPFVARLMLAIGSHCNYWMLDPGFVQDDWEYHTGIPATLAVGVGDYTDFAVKPSESNAGRLKRHTDEVA